jgi:hypothetical protein
MIWNENNKNIQGLPRPKYNVSQNYIDKFNNKIRKMIPVPWQSKPIFNDTGTAFNVIKENEQKILLENICGYCSLNFLNDEYCYRWKSDNPENIEINYDKGPRVFSDISPLHIKCMKQARIFCTFLNQRPNSEFEYGQYQDLKQNFLNSINK